mgnify:CR=1 FL=1
MSGVARNVGGVSGKRRGGGFECTACGVAAPRWLGRCTGCGGWGTVEQVPGGLGGQPGGGSSGDAQTDHRGGPLAPAVPITQVPLHRVRARPTGIGELDRVLGGGLIPGAVLLLSGEPGVGKSTLLLEVSAALARAGQRVLYATGEESASAVRGRAQRIRAEHEGLWLVEAHDMGAVLAGVAAADPDLVVIDSVQTLTLAGIDAAPGSVSQVKAVAEAVGAMSRRTGATALLVGHVTKDGSLAGPRTLEHLVDVVCMLEGERHARLRLLRSVKNRYGPTDEVGCFELDEEGMTEVGDPSQLFLTAGSAPGPGSCVTVGIEGRRPMVVEVQALVSFSPGSPRRVASGLDATRLSTVLAVLERHGEVLTTTSDVYAATVGGLRLSEPSVDLALALAVASSVRHEPIPPGLIALGELGLGGELRPVPSVQRRLSEGRRLGFRAAIVPVNSDYRTTDAALEGMRITMCATLGDALRAVHDPGLRSQRLAAMSL